MSAHYANWDEHTLDLAVEQVTVGLTASDREALRALVDQDDFEEFEFSVAAVQLGAMNEIEDPPAGFIERLGADARNHFGGESIEQSHSTNHEVPGPAPTQSRMAPILAIGGWLAAAVLLFAFVWKNNATPTPAPGAEDLRTELVASASDLMQIDWTVSEDPFAQGVTGDVVWSKKLQEGYMRFSGLAANDPTQCQYQLWIFDSTRAEWEEKPVDGGVFDVTPEGEVIVPIDPKLEVRDAALFAITVEVPGGVVVSKRDRIVLTASI